MNRLVSGSVLVLLFSAATALAQPVQNRVERRQDRRETQQDKREMADDRRDLTRLTAILQRFDVARATRNMAVLNTIDRELRDILAVELAEGRTELAHDRKELSRSAQEIRSDGREIARNQAQGAPPAVRADDRGDLRDDRLDRADDRQDLAAEKHEQRTKRVIARELSRLYFRHDPASLARKRALITELIRVERAELAKDSQELREDKRELREDRRETREDIRQP